MTTGTRVKAGDVLAPSEMRALFLALLVGYGLLEFIGVLMQPWRLLADPSGYIFTWLIAYSALLGPIVLIFSDVAGRLIFPPGEIQVGVGRTNLDDLGSGQTLTVDYLGQVYEADAPFDESYSKEPAEFPIGVGQVITGWDERLVGRTVGSRVILEIPPADGYPEGDELAAELEELTQVLQATPDPHGVLVWDPRRADWQPAGSVVEIAGLELPVLHRVHRSLLKLGMAGLGNGALGDETGLVDQLQHFGQVTGTLERLDVAAFNYRARHAPRAGPQRRRSC